MRAAPFRPPRLVATLCLTAVLIAVSARPAPAAEGSRDATVSGIFGNLTSAEAVLVEAGEPVIRTVAKSSRLALTVSDPLAQEIRSKAAALRANYMAELILLSPRKQNDPALERLAAALEDVKGYVSIPYWSRQNQRTYDLFDEMEILSRTSTDGLVVTEVVQHMEPFDDFKARYTLRPIGEAGMPARALWYTSENLSPIVYRRVRAVAPGNMVWFLYAFPTDAALAFYGLGLVKTFDLLGLLRDRLETSFMGRVKAFMEFMSKKL